MKAIHSINTTVTSLHGVTPLEVVIGRPLNEKSVLLAASKDKKDKVPKELNQIPNDIKGDSRKILSKAIHKVIQRGQDRQIISYRKK